MLPNPAVGTCAPAQTGDQGFSGSYPSAVMLMSWSYSLGADGKPPF